MEIIAIITKWLNGIILAVKSVSSFFWTFKRLQEFISILIGMTGDIRGRIMIGGLACR
ncbi:hypothetical protein [Peribacillus sp. NPDC058075]|uniref:hypothetical protein n=1 Tax=unclassified Peribacillus TaxID=2675266 RepID=UPI0036DE09DD